MSSPLVFAITLNWNRLNDTVRCIDSLINQTYTNLRVLVVDNHSDDGSPEEIAKLFPEVEQILNQENLGFAKGINIGLRRALSDNADYVFISNNDAFISLDSIEILINHVVDNTGALAPLVYYTNPPNKIWSTGGYIHPWTLERTDKWAGKSDPGNWPDKIELDFVPGCGMFFPRETLIEVGLFDEDFPMYYEDMDLCLRIRRAGLSTHVVPNAKMWHKVASSSGGSDMPYERYWMARSSIRYFNKHVRGFQVPVVILWRTGSAIRTTYRLLLQKRWQSINAYWSGLKDGLIDIQRGNK